MTAIEALQALKEGKKIRDVKWPYGNYVVFREKDGKMINQYGHLDSLTIEKEQDMEGEYEIFTDCDQKSILTIKEKEILSHVAYPFRREIKYIKKVRFNLQNCETLCIQFIEGLDFTGIAFRDFKPGTEFVGMELGKEYTLEELELYD